jgi:hypothetical protein
MSTPTYKTGNPYFDDAAFANLQKQINKNSSSSTADFSIDELETDGLSEAYAASQAASKKTGAYNSNQDLDDLKQDYSNLDEFTGWNPKLLENESNNYFDNDRRRRKQSSISSKKKVKATNFTGEFADEFEESAIERFFGFVDSMIKNLAEMADEAFAKINPFSNWITAKPKQVKMAPPPMAEQSPLFLRESFKPKRSPHLWKSDPKPWWHLAFGNETNNKVIENLIKYQNDTITADA